MMPNNKNFIKLIQMSKNWSQNMQIKTTQLQYHKSFTFFSHFQPLSVQFLDQSQYQNLLFEVFLLNSCLDLNMESHQILIILISYSPILLFYFLLISLIFYIFSSSFRILSRQLQIFYIILHIVRNTIFLVNDI